MRSPSQTDRCSTAVARTTAVEPRTSASKVTAIETEARASRKATPSVRALQHAVEGPPCPRGSHRSSKIAPDERWSPSALPVEPPSAGPLPIADFGQVLAVLAYVLLVLEQLLSELLLHVEALLAGLRQAIDGVDDEMEAVQIVQHRHVERGRDRALFLVAADVDVVVIGAAVGQPVDEPRVGMEGEDDRLVLGEDLVEVFVAEAWGARSEAEAS